MTRECWTYDEGMYVDGPLSRGPIPVSQWNREVADLIGRATLDGHKPWPVDYDPAAAFGLDGDWVCESCNRPLRMESISGDGPAFAHRDES